MSTTHNAGASRPSGTLSSAMRRNLGDLADLPKPSLRWRLANLLERRRGFPAYAAAMAAGRVFGAAVLTARTEGVTFRPSWDRLAPEQALRLKVALQRWVPLSPAQLAAVKAEIADWPTDVRELARFFGGDVVDFGLISTRLVTDNGVGYIVDAFQNLTELENMKYHGYGTGTTAEAQGDSALVTELTTQYNPDSTRPTGTTTEGASANIYRTVATLSPDSGGTIAITEHGIFSATSAGVLLDRSKFSAINLVAGSDSLQTTYELTCTAGG